MRRIAANYVFPVASPPVKNGILELEEDGRITGIVDPGSNLREFRRMEFHNGILVPGFVNCHSHLELSGLKGKIPRGTGLARFLRLLQKERSRVEEASARQAMQDADRQMRREGIRVCGDVSNTGSSFPVKAESPLHYHTFVEVFGFTSREIGQKYREAGLLLHQLKEEYGLPGDMVPHAGYSSDSRLMRRIRSSMDPERAILSMHYREASRREEFAIRTMARFRHLSGKGKPGIWHWEGLSLRKLARVLKDYTGGLQLLLVHNRFAGTKDVDYASRTFTRPAWVFCPRSNLYIHEGLPDIPLFLRRGHTIALGTDSLASNESLSMLEELKVLQEHFPRIPFESMLSWATLQGAKALGVEQNYGSFRPGGYPGVNLVKPFDFKQMRLLPESRVYPIS